VWDLRAVRCFVQEGGVLWMSAVATDSCCGWAMAGPMSLFRYSPACKIDDWHQTTRNELNCRNQGTEGGNFE
jgi:hypothetical protein